MIFLSDEFKEKFFKAFNIEPELYIETVQICDCGNEVYKCVHCQNKMTKDVPRKRFPIIDYITFNKIRDILIKSMGEMRIEYFESTNWYWCSDEEFTQVGIGEGPTFEQAVLDFAIEANHHIEEKVRELFERFIRWKHD